MGFPTGNGFSAVCVNTLGPSPITMKAPLALLFIVGTTLLAQVPWLELKGGHYSIFYQPGFERDAGRAKAWVDDAERLMQDKYGVVATHYQMSIYLQPAPTSSADVNTAHNHCCHSVGGGDSTGTIDMLAPSAPAMKSVTAISSLG